LLLTLLLYLCYVGKQVIDFSSNSLGTKGVLTLGRAIQHFSHGLQVLNLANCNLSSKGIVGLMNSFSRNYGVSLSLEVLNLSYNKMDDAASKALEEWLYRVREHSQLRYVGHV
jgi:Ran GTPase-activating protein (RanGAP) involved in mRNA processing and transport